MSKVPLFTGWFLFHVTSIYLLFSTSALLGMHGFSGGKGMPDDSSLTLTLFLGSFAYIYIASLAYYFRNKETFPFILVLMYIGFGALIDFSGNLGAAVFSLGFTLGPAIPFLCIGRVWVDGLVLLPFTIGAAVFAFAPD